MTTNQWSPPVQLQQVYPNCWGNPRSFDPNSRECRGCGVQTSCKEKVDSQRVSAVQQPVYQQPAYQAPVYQPPTYQPVAWSPPQQSTNPWAKPAATAWQPQQQVQQQVQQYAAVVPQAVQYFQQGQEYYGRYMDPIHYAIASAPLPPRTQMPGESFGSRFMKNMFLGALESVMEEGLKGVRQMVLPPSPTNKIIDVK